MPGRGGSSENSLVSGQHASNGISSSSFRILSASALIASAESVIQLRRCGYQIVLDGALLSITRLYQKPLNAFNFEALIVIQVMERRKGI